MNKNLFVVFLLTACLSCKKKPEENTTNPPSYTKQTIQYKNIIGVDANLLSLDIYYFGNTQNLKPVVVYVHGGGWVNGDKANQLENKLSLFNQLSYVFVSINYRLSPNNSNLDPARIKYPDHNNDVADAVKWIIDNISSYGGDKNKIVLLGHSAGAHLVALTGTSNQFLPSRGVPLNFIRGVASIDTEGYDVAANGTEPAYINAFGTNPAVWSEASPVVQVTVGNAYPRFFIAKRGTPARIAIADSFITKLQTTGTSVSQVNGSQYTHEGINDAIGAPGETAITTPLKEFLTVCFQ
jgi:pimeloyl-ACP methyl ester carboxylesterase